MAVPERTLDWITRATLALVIGAHAVTKFTQQAAFMDKFDLSTTVAVLTGLAELSGCVGLLAGGAMLPRRVGAVLSLLGVAAIGVVQVGAIITVHWPRWWYYANGVEYNLVLLALLAIVVVSSVRSPREGAR